MLSPENGGKSEPSEPSILASIVLIGLFSLLDLAQTLFLFASLPLFALLLLPGELFRWDWLAAARLRVGVVRGAARSLLGVFLLAPFRSSVLEPNL